MWWTILSLILLIACLVIAFGFNNSVRSDINKTNIARAANHRRRHTTLGQPAEEEPELLVHTPMFFWWTFVLTFIPSFLILSVLFSFTYTGICDRKVQIWLNKPVSGYIDNGIDWTYPWLDTEAYDVCRRTIDMAGNDTLSGTAKGGVALTQMDAVIPIRLIPNHLWQVRAKVGNQDKLMELFRNTVRSAGRATQSQYEWRDIAYSKRGDVEAYFSAELSKRLTQDLIGAGLTEEAAANVFVIPEVRLRAVRPSESVLAEQANYEKAQVQQDVAHIRAEAAKKEAEATANRLSIGQTLKPTNIQEAALLLRALADYSRAEAMSRIASDQERNVPVMIMNGESPASVPAPITVPAAK